MTTESFGGDSATKVPYVYRSACRDDGPPEDSLKKVVVKMRHDWSQCTLQDVESFKKALIHKFFLPEFDITQLHSPHC